MVYYRPLTSLARRKVQHFSAVYFRRNFSLSLSLSLSLSASRDPVEKTLESSLSFSRRHPASYLKTFPSLSLFPATVGWLYFSRLMGTN